MKALKETRILADQPLRIQLIRLAFALFLAYMAVALPLPVLSKFVAQQLHFNDSLAGLSVGMSFITTVFSRILAGRYADARGATRCFFYGIAFYTVANIISLSTAFLIQTPYYAYGLLLLGRALLGVGESCVNVGMISWGLSQSGASRSGQVMIWMGIGMYGAYTLGAPIGLWIDTHFGFAHLMFISAIMPLIGAATILGIPKAKRIFHAKKTFSLEIWRQVLAPGLVLAAQGIGFALLGAFVTLYFLDHQWPYAGFALTAFGIGFIMIRFIGTQWPDHYGALKVATYSLAIETLGQLMLWLAIIPEMALLGALLTGCGCSMIFPTMGVEVIRRVSESARSTAIASFALFQDIAYGVSAPLVGLVTLSLGYSSAFMIGSIAGALGLLVLIMMHQAAKSF